MSTLEGLMHFIPLLSLVLDVVILVVTISAIIIALKTYKDAQKLNFIEKLPLMELSGAFLDDNITTKYAGKNIKWVKRKIENNTIKISECEVKISELISDKERRGKYTTFKHDDKLYMFINCCPIKDKEFKKNKDNVIFVLDVLKLRVINTKHIDNIKFIKGYVIPKEKSTVIKRMTRQSNLKTTPHSATKWCKIPQR